MWVVRFVALLLSGCAFNPPEANPGGPDAAPGDAAPMDAPYVQRCLTDPGYVARGAHSYKVLAAENRNYDESLAACAADGAYLATIESRDENMAIAALIPPAPTAWIGLDDLAEENQFQWVTGAAFDPDVFTGFASGEPSDSGVEDCTSLRPDGTWNDFTCADRQRAAVCECEPGYQPPRMPSCLTSSGGETQVVNGRRMFIRTTAATWAAADADCKSIDASLIIVGDDDEDDALERLFTGASWLGYSDVEQEGTFRWVTGATSAYVDWNVGAPGSADCAVQLPNGRWDTRECTEPQQYACECDPSP